MGSKIKVAATGDSIINMRISVHKEPEFLSLFEKIREADVRFTNFEVVLCPFDKGYPAAEYGVPYQIAEPTLADEFAWAGFNMVSRANNHAVDWGYEGLFSSSRALDERGIVHSGAGQNLGRARSPGYLETEKGRVAMISSASTFPSFSRAGDARRDVQGRPGLNPLRYETEIRITKESLEQLKSILESVGAKATFGPITDNSIKIPKIGYGERLSALNFVESDVAGLYTKPYELDLKGNIRSVEDARRMADLVLVAHHGHESDGSDPYKPAKFIETYARACIDAGADAFLGHGPHLLRGIEIYKGKPILYSMGNFIFHFDVSKFQGQEHYDESNLKDEATPSDAYDADSLQRSEKDWTGWAGFAFEPPFWDGFLADLTFDGTELVEFKIHPVTLGFGSSRTQRGRPVRASHAESIRILEHISEYSSAYGTEIEIEEDVGIVQL